jgi:hypothetical protein
MAQRAFQELRGSRYALAADVAAADDHGAAARMLEAGGDLGEIERRWRAALVHEGFPRSLLCARLRAGVPTCRSGSDIGDS